MKYICLLLIIFISFSASARTIPDNNGLMEDSYIKPVEIIPINDLSDYIKSSNLSADSLFRIGHTFYMDNKPDIAEKYFLKAIEGGSNEALIGLGRLYRDSDRSTEALPYFSRAAKANMPEGIYEMGVVYERGIGVLADFDTALANYTKSANAGYYNALIKLGLYADSISNIELSTQYYDFAYKRVIGKKQKQLLGYILAQNNNTLAKSEKNEIQRLQYYKKSGALGNSEAQFEVAKAFELGTGTIQNLEKAMLLYNGLAEKEYTPAMIRIGQLYYDGLNFARDYAISRKWFQKAAELGDPIGARYLSDMLANGRGMEKDTKLAEEWKKRADALSIPRGN
jgi:uncharacterized protein